MRDSCASGNGVNARMKRRPLGRARAGRSSWWRLYESADAGIEAHAPGLGHAPQPGKVRTWRVGSWEGRDQDMTRRTVPFLLIGTMLLVAGCAGRDFVRPRPDTLMLGKTSYEDVLRQLGDPYRRARL